MPTPPSYGLLLLPATRDGQLREDSILICHQLEAEILGDSFDFHPQTPDGIDLT